MLKSPDTSTPSSASLRGHFLIATPVIGSGFFNRSLTYICDHTDQGSMGIVVNQCLEIGLIDMLTHLDIEATSACPDPLILAGGPVANVRLNMDMANLMSFIVMPVVSKPRI